MWRREGQGSAALRNKTEILGLALFQTKALSAPQGVAEMRPRISESSPKERYNTIRSNESGDG